MRHRAKRSKKNGSIVVAARLRARDAHQDERDKSVEAVDTDTDPLHLVLRSIKKGAFCPTKGVTLHNKVIEEAYTEQKEEQREGQNGQRLHRLLCLVDGCLLTSCIAC